MPTISQRYSDHKQTLDSVGQSHLLAYWAELDDEQRAQLLDDLDQFDARACAALVEPYVRRKAEIPLPAEVLPPPILPAEPDTEHADIYRRALATGEQAIASGQVGAFTVAGGQGTRLGYDGPKGAFAISPVRNITLFQLFAESLLGVQRRYGHRPHWYIMTSPANHGETVQFFEQHGHFGLGADGVTFFPQGQMPAFLPDGRIALSARHRVSLSPDGHGGSLRALADSGALADMRARGVAHISYFQVDNPLVRAIDPLFIGLHIERQSQMSSKAIRKADDMERVGNFCLADGRVAVIEYSDLPEQLARSRNADGTRRFDAGSIAIHVLSREFVESLTSPGANLALPWHRAEKKLSVLGDDGQLVQPTAPNVVKLEMFVFDAIPLARNPLVVYTRREEEFSPVKNATGVDSAETARRDLIRRAAAWLEACGGNVPRDASGEPAAVVEISPAYALDAADLRQRLSEPPHLSPGERRLLG